MMKKYLFSNSTTELNASLGLLLLRVGAGLLMARHGWEKFQGYTEMVKQFAAPKFILISWMSNNVALGATIFAELVCAILIAIGLATRPAAAMIAFTMFVARFFVPGVPAMGQELSSLYLIISVVLIITGAGKYSFDSKMLVGKKRLFS